MQYETVVGLEVHCELNTCTKIYCSCKNEFGGEPNTRCCPICTGMPGTLPSLNEQVVEHAVRMGLALGCEINLTSRQARKNYFYPDLPKAYQISQFDRPLCEHGFLDILLDEGRERRRIGITRLHIEEDAGKLLHDDRFSGTLIDYNRCGVPLIEIVSEPDLRSSEEAHAFLEAIKTVLQQLNISDCKMQEGSIRCDVNVSVRPAGQQELGTRCEMKNVNSFSGAVRAIEYEAARQRSVLESGGIIEQETRRWDDASGRSILLRSKEEAQDYRYFSEPDLPPIQLTEAYVQALRATIPELPADRMARYMQQLELPYMDALLLTQSPEKAALFEETLTLGCAAKSAANWILSDVSRILNERSLSLSETVLTPQKLCELIEMIRCGEISNTAAKTVLEELMFRAVDARQVIEEKGLGQISGRGALEEIARSVLAGNEKSVADYKRGKTNALGYLVGQCMRTSAGKGNPALLKEILTELLSE